MLFDRPHDFTGRRVTPSAGASLPNSAAICVTGPTFTSLPRCWQRLSSAPTPSQKPTVDDRRKNAKGAQRQDTCKWHGQQKDRAAVRRRIFDILCPVMRDHCPHGKEDAHQQESEHRDHRRKQCRANAPKNNS